MSLFSDNATPGKYMTAPSDEPAASGEHTTSNGQLPGSERLEPVYG